MQHNELVESLSQGFLLMMERLSPRERAAFVLRTVFDYEYSQIADVIDKTEAHARQIVSRAKSRLRQNQSRFETDSQNAGELAERFVSACRVGDVKSIERLLTDDIEVYSDGGGKVSAARVVIRGRSRSARFLSGVFSKRRRDCDMHAVTVNGNPGVAFPKDGAVFHVVSLRLENGVRAVYMTLNPDKLSRWSLAKID
jgi:RNA polymerase sigma-70 factor (ECF subfamily)